MPEFDELTAENKNKPAIMKITFPTPEDLQNCENEIQEVINRICVCAIKPGTLKQFCF